MSTSHKQPKVNRYQLNKPVPSANFEGLEEELDDVRTNVWMGKVAKSSSIFVTRIDNFASLSQLLKTLAIGEYEIKIINEQIKIQ
jgi:hypothetical protein